MTLKTKKVKMNLENYDEVGHCGWCGEEIGFREIGGLRTVSLYAHTKNKHPVRHTIAHMLAPLLKGGLWYCPVIWSRIGRK